MRAALVAVALILSGCAGGEPAPASLELPTVSTPSTIATQPPPPPPTFVQLASEDTVVVYAGGPDEIRFNRTGWARVEIHAIEPITLQPSMRHETIEDLELFSDGGEGIHDHVNYTFVHVFAEGTSPVGADAWYWNWWGTPNWSVWPHSSELFDRSSVKLQRNESAILLVVSTVTGYTVDLGIADDESELPYVLDLGPRAGHVLWARNANQSALLHNDAARLQYVREWTTDWFSTEPSMLLAKSWTEALPVSAYAGSQSDQLEIREQTESEPLVLPFPSWGAQGNGYSYSALTLTGFREDPGTFEMRRLLREDEVGVKNYHEGAAFLRFPIHRASLE